MPLEMAAITAAVIGPPLRPSAEIMSDSPTAKVANRSAITEQAAQVLLRAPPSRGQGCAPGNRRRPADLPGLPPG